MPRQKLDIDPEKVRQLAKFGVNNVDIARFFGCSEATIRQGFLESLAKGRAERKITLHQRQYEAADAGNIAMLIWLGKQDLGQSDKTEMKHEHRTMIDADEQQSMLTSEETIELASDLDKALITARRERKAIGNGTAGDDPGGLRQSH